MRRWTATLRVLGGTYALTLAGILGAASTGWVPIRLPAGIGLLALGVAGLACALLAARRDGPDGRTRRSWRWMSLGYALALALNCVAAAMVVLAAGDGYLGHLRAYTGEVEPTAWQFGCWSTTLWLVAVAAAEQHRQALARRESREPAVTDELTGLANRAQVHEVLDRALARGARTGRSTAVLLVGMDGGKRVDDTLGHEAGDRLLVEFGETVRRSVLGGDLVGRLGGDEFAVVLHDIGRVDHAVAVARRILTAARQPVRFGDHTLRASASVGVAIGGPGECTGDELLHRADLAMHQARRRTDGTRWQCWDRGLTEAAAPSLEQELRGAIAEGQLRLLYQPIVALPGREVTGVEALVRWEHPRHGLLLPETFVPLAERAGVIEELGRWVLEQASAQARAWQRRVPSLQLNVNVSPRQLDNQGFTAEVLRILDRSGFFPGHLVLEVPESAVIGEADSIAQLEALTTAGIRVALDDFGTGYSSLRYLTRLPVDALKLDSCFVAELDGTPKGSAVAQAVLRLGQMLHLDTVAEGVEDESQARELTLLGCEKAQGRHFSGPVPAADLERQLPAGTTAGGSGA